MANKNQSSRVVGLGFCSFSVGGNSSVIDVKNGKIVRIRPLHFDWKYDKKDFNPWKMEARGQVFEPTTKSLIPPYSLGYKKRVYSPNRILFPMKRSDWDPEGDRHPENRGTSKYVRISWDEALDIIVNEIKRVQKKYGPYAILSQSDGHGETKTVHGPHGCQNRLLELMGGYTLQTRNTDSWEGWYWGAKHVWGGEPVGQMAPVANVMYDIAKNTDQILFWGCDPETTPWGFDGQQASRLCYWYNKLGIKCIYICPDLNYGAAVHADKWIPIRPGTDAALQLAIAYTWMSEGTYDKKYVATHTFGYDKFEAYVLGKEDGVPKTPEWAAEKTAIPAATIKALAREWASRRTTIAHGNGGPGIRSVFATENGRLEVLLLAMQGVGKPGAHQVKFIEWGMHGRQPMPPGAINLGIGRIHTGFYPPALEKAEKLLADPANKHGLAGPWIQRQFIPKDLIHDALLKPPISWYGVTLSAAPLEDQFVKYTYPAEGCSEVHMIWTDTPCWITCWNDSNTYMKALRSPKIEFILAQHPWLENDCLFADLILPVSTKLELEDISSETMSGQYRVAFYEGQSIDHIGESKSDYEIACLVAERLGLLTEFTGNKTIPDLVKEGFDISGLDKVISFEDFKKNGYFVVPTDPQWDKYPAGMKAFHDEPEKNPLKTPSGKIEFFAQNLASHFPDDKERPPVPHWIEKSESHDERISSTRAKKYPLLVVSNHGRWRVHANHDDITWIREIPTSKVMGRDGYNYEPLWMNPSDAEARGIKSGDVVKIHNERGVVLAGAYVTQRIMPGSVYIDHGARHDAIVPGELDRGGAINTITPHNITSKNATGMVVSSFLVDVEKANLDELMDKYPEAFNKPYHPGAGLRMERALIKK